MTMPAEYARTRQAFRPHKIETNTIWYNPTEDEMFVDVFEGSSGPGNHYNAQIPTRLIFPAKQKTAVPSKWDSVIQRVQCSNEECRRHGNGFCMANHVGTIIGGHAPQLRREGQQALLPPELDPKIAQKKELEAEIASKNMARAAAEQAQLIALARQREIELADKAQADEDAKREAEEKALASAEAEAMAKLDEATRPGPKATPKK